METSSNNLVQDSVLGSKYFNPDYLFNQGSGFFHTIYNYLTNTSEGIINIYHIVLFFLATFFLIIIFYTMVRLLEIRKKEKNHLKHELEEYAHHNAEHEKKLQQEQAVSQNPRWIEVLNYLLSTNAGDWKLAVIEADSMLEGLMDQLGFKGETLGDKLKSATQEKFRNLTNAWEVHTIRNKIAHEGTSFELSEREAKRVIALYEQIFREFGYI